MDSFMFVFCGLIWDIFNGFVLFCGCAGAEAAGAEAVGVLGVVATAATLSIQGHGASATWCCYSGGVWGRYSIFFGERC